MSMAQYEMGGGKRVSRIQDLISFYETERSQSDKIQQKTPNPDDNNTHARSYPTTRQISTEGHINLPTNC